MTYTIPCALTAPGRPIPVTTPLPLTVYAPSVTSPEVSQLQNVPVNL